MARGPVPALGGRTVTEVRGGARRARALLDRVIGLADEPTDDDDLRLRKRVLVMAGYILILGALQLPALAQGLPLTRRRAEARSHELLTNAIPPSIAARLQRGEERIAEAYPETTVLFADLAGFTAWARGTDPASVVRFLD